MSRAVDGWRSTGRRHSDGLVESRQRIIVAAPLVEHSEDGARSLGRSYWLGVTRASRGLVRCRDGGDGVELLLLGLPPPLLTLGASELTVDAERISCSHPITGGLLAARAGGSLTLAQTSGEIEIQVDVIGFTPRVGLLYARLQRRLHESASRWYFRQLSAERPS